MRRHTTKQPSGPATRASPTPATSARVKKSSSIGELLGRALAMAVVIVLIGVVIVMPMGVGSLDGRAVRLPHPAVGQMRVIVVVAVDRQHLAGARAEQPHVFRTPHD